MLTYSYDWKRFWMPQGSEVPLDNEGFLQDPDGHWLFSSYAGQLQILEQWDDARCLVLLGEPGIGKSREVEQYVSTAVEDVLSNGRLVLSVNLVVGDNQQEIVDMIVKHPTFIRWQNGSDEQLDLFIDSLDEGLLRVSGLVSRLILELPKYPLDRLYLRISCRTAEWRPMLERKLREWFPNGVSVIELAPLRKHDVIAAAAARQLDSDRFLNEVTRVDAMPLAINPLTLELLLSLYQTNAKMLPDTQTQLYEKGCMRMCTEVGETRVTAKSTGLLSSNDRMLVAGRIAALGLICNRYAVYKGVKEELAPPTALTISDIEGVVRKPNAPSLVIEREHVEETLGTMFTSRGTDLLGFAHHSYAEFLAAWYLNRYDIPFEQLEALFWQEDGSLLPQLRETAAWLASMRADVFRNILRTDTDVILGGDLAARTEAERAQVIERLLDSAGKLDFRDRIATEGRHRLQKLRHVTIVDQLAPVILDTTAPFVKRCTAIDLGMACELSALGSSLATVALDPNEDLTLRTYAITALSRTGDFVTRARIRPLLGVHIEDDPFYELEGALLIALWPDHISASELFGMLRQPTSNHFGLYASFLHSYAGQRLKPHDLPVALSWLTNQPVHNITLQHTDYLVGSILQRAWDNLDDDTILEAFAPVCFKRLKAHVPVVVHRNEPDSRFAVYANEGHRRRLANAVISLIDNPEKETYFLTNSATPLLIADDIEWMLDRLDQPNDDRAYQVYVRAIGRLYRPGTWEFNEQLVSACQRHPQLSAELHFWLQPIEIQSARADELREHESWSRPHTPALLDPPPDVRIKHDLDEFEAGNLDWWWQLKRDLSLEPTSDSYGDMFAPDLTTLPGWKAADSSTRKRIVDAADQYVRRQNPETEKWFATNSYPERATAGYQALRLLASEAPEVYHRLPSDLWKVWAPIILDYPTADREKQQHAEMVAFAFAKAQEEVISRLVQLIHTENEGGKLFSMNKADGLWSPQLAEAFLDVVQSGELTPRNQGELLGTVLAQKPSTIGEAQRQQALKLARAAIKQYHTSDKLEAAVEVARIGALECPHEVWDEIWQSINTDETFGKAFFENLALYDRHAFRFGVELPDKTLGEIYLWLEAHYLDDEPATHDPRAFSSPSKAVMFLRQGIIRLLVQRATVEAIDALRSIHGAHPELDWVRDLIVRMEALVKERAWVPPDPDKLIKLLDDRQRRWVESADHLLEVVTNSLGRLQTKLQGVTPRAPQYWDRQRDKTWRPLDEERLSDMIKNFLEDDLQGTGIVVNREVQIKKGTGSSSGEDTDLYFQAVKKDDIGNPIDTITIVIEHKGCWHKELLSAMETQLAGRYLAHGECRRGLYLVTWFQSSEWDTSDSRKAPSITMDELRERLDTQAVKLSKDGLMIRSLVLDASLDNGIRKKSSSRKKRN